MGFTFSPAIISYATANVVAGAVAFPILAPGPTNNFPKANCRQMIILNSGATTLYFGSVFANVYANLPPPWNPAGVGIIPTLGFNCTIIPAGGSLSIELDTFEKRGQFDPGAVVPVPAVAFEPLTIIFFAAPPATNATALITYLQTNGPF